MANVRKLLGFDAPYWRINREERNYAALLYALLLRSDNLDRFLDLVGCTFPRSRETLAAYVEYAYLRDAWDHAGRSNDLKRSIITELLDTADVRSLENASVLEWNQHFGVGTPAASARWIQSPARWTLVRFSDSVADDRDFLATCRFKWCFNIKPDLVIHTDESHAVVVEAKYTAGEGSYPASTAEKVIFKARNLDPVRQTELQQHLFERLLGVTALHRYLVKDPAAQPTDTTITWRQVFGALDTTGVPPFVTAWLRTLTEDPATTG